MTDFIVPPNGETYFHTVKDRCKDLILHHIWNGISQTSINRWFNNFDVLEEKYFAACILDSLIYRSEEQTISLANHLFTKILPGFLKSNGLAIKGHRNLINLMRDHKIDPKIRIVSVANKRDRPSKSSEIVLRLLRRTDLALNESWFIKPEEVEAEIGNGTQYFIFIDDFLGTGSQFKEMADNLGFGITFTKSIFIYAPLVAHTSGISYLKQKFPKLSVLAAEYLDEKSNVFGMAFSDKHNSPLAAQKFYDSLLVKYKLGPLAKENKYGFGNLALAYGFQHAIPDSSLNIIWDDTNNWFPLIKK